MASAQFPNGYVAVEHDAVGSLDEISWLTAEALGSDPEAVPSGAALYLRGWAIDLPATAPAAKVFVTVDGNRTYQARIGTSRPDVAKALGNDDLESSGFEVVIPTGRLARGAHTAEVAVVDPTLRRYAKLRASGSFRIVMGGDELPQVPRRELPSVGVIDEVRDASMNQFVVMTDNAATVTGGKTIYVRGWAILEEPREPFSEMYALLDNRWSYRTNYGIVRPDVAKGMGNIDIEEVGFDFWLSTVGLQRGTHFIEFLGLTLAGNALVRSPTLRLTVS